MQEPTEAAEASPASIPMEHAPANLNEDEYRTVTVRRKAAKRTFPWDLLPAEEIELASPPQGQDAPATKKPRLEEDSKVSSLLAAATDDDTGTDHADTVTDHADTGTDHADTGTDHVNADYAEDTRTLGKWTPEEEVQLNHAIAVTCKKRHS